MKRILTDRPDGDDLPDVFPFSLRVTPHTRRLRREQRPPRRNFGLLLAVVSPSLFAIGVGIYLGDLNWSSRNRSALATAILNIRIVDGWVPVFAFGLGLAALAFLVVRRPTRQRVLSGSIAAVGGAAIALVVLTVASVTDVFGVQLSATTSVWVVATFSVAAIAIVSMWSHGWRRKYGAAISLFAAIFAGFIGVNADFGLDPTVADLAGVSTQRTITIVQKPTPTPSPTLLANGALWANWHAPAGMPATGTTGQVIIPNTLSGFRARPAGLYLPPAALVPNPPSLPLVIMMMGQPGNPDPSFQAPILNAFAARHSGLAPVVLVVDQIGNPAIDPLCLDTSRYGKAETYVTQDVVNWARTHLPVLQDPAHWTIAGYSNGGECALSFGAKYANIWENVLDISGEKYPGSDNAAKTLSVVFRGNRAAYEATWPLSILAQHQYSDTVGIFTVGSNDYGYRKQALAVSAAAKAAGWNTTYFEVLNGGHVLGALNGGLKEGYTVLYPRLGLSDPATAP